MMQAWLALLPCAVVIAVVLGLGWSGLAAAAASLGVTVALVLARAFAVPTVAMFGQAVVDAALLTALVAATLVPGVLFIEATRRLKAPEAVARAVSALRLPEPQAAVLIALGLGVLVESLTGMGVSLLLTMPLLAGRLERTRAIALALVGMSLMPWGALAIAGTVGATLANIEPERFGLAIWRSGGRAGRSRRCCRWWRRGWQAVAVRATSWLRCSAASRCGWRPGLRRLHLAWRWRAWVVV